MPATSEIRGDKKGHSMKIRTSFFAAVTRVVLTALACQLSLSAKAQTNIIFDTETKLVPSVGAQNLEFAIDVAIDGKTAAVGAQQSGHGSVYLYSLIGTNWQQTQIVTAGKAPNVLDQFGSAVALSSNVLVVGQPSSFQTTNQSGEVYVYTNSGTTWVFQQKLTEVGSPVPGDGFGSAVDVSGNTLVVANPLESSVEPNSGALYVYQQIGGTWLLQAKLKPVDPIPNQLVGSSVSIDGDTIVAGADSVVYVFVRNGTNWTQQQEIFGGGAPFEFEFARDVAFEGNVIAITAQDVGVTRASTNPVVQIYVRNGTFWSLQQTIFVAHSDPNIPFGNTVAIHNGILAVGIPGREVDGLPSAGAIEIYEFNGTNWVFTQEVAANDVTAGAFLGASVDVGDSGIIGGAPFDTDVGRQGQGAAYIFSTSGTNPPVVVPIATASPNVLFPPNHKLVPVTITVSNHDSFNSCRIVSVTSNEPGGKNSPDFIITGDLTLQLRAERSGKSKSGRIYTIEVACTDGAGNTTSTTVVVTVPHNRNH